MFYAISDLHGCYEKYMEMLERINFSDEDTLYVLGDVVDRGEGGIKILQDMMSRNNVVPLRGNHDYMAFRLLNMLSRPLEDGEKEKYIDTFQMWMIDGGLPTYESFIALSAEDQKRILMYMNSFLLYEEITVGENNFFLAHTVPERERFVNFDLLMWQEFIVGEPEYEKEYCSDKYIVTGHTPTSLISDKFIGRIYKGNNHIAIDCGTVFGNSLGCICLDTLEEFYIE